MIEIWIVQALLVMQIPVMICYFYAGRIWERRQWNKIVKINKLDFLFRQK